MATERIYSLPTAPGDYTDHYIIADKSGNSTAVKVLVSDMISDLSFTGGNIATLTNGAASAGQKIVTVDSTSGFLDTAKVVYTLAGGTIEYNNIDNIDSVTQITLTTNIGTGGIANDTYFSMISPSEYAAAIKVNAGNGVNKTLDVAMAAALGGVFSVTAFGATGDGVTDDTTAIQAALDAAETAGGGRIVFPDGKYLVTQLEIPNGAYQAAHGGEHYILQGNGSNSMLISETTGAMFVWKSDARSAKTSFYNLWTEHRALGGYVMTWATSDIDSYRLSLHIEDCVFNWRGDPTANGGTIAINLEGLIVSSFIDTQIRGGSPGEGGFLGWGMKIDNSSTCHFDQLYFGNAKFTDDTPSASAGRGIWIEGGGNHIVTGVRVEGGSRVGPTYYISNTQGNSFNQLRAEGADSDPVLLIENSHTCTFYDASLPGVPYGANNNIIEITNSEHIVFIGGRADSQQVHLGTGKSIVIDNDSAYVTFHHFNITSAGSCAADVSYPTAAGNAIALFLLDGNSGGSFQHPPTAMRNLGTYHTPYLAIGENGSAIQNVHFGTKPWNPDELADGATATTTVTVANALQSEIVTGVGFTSITSGNWKLWGYMSGSATATVYLTNNTGGAVNLADGALMVVTMRFET